MRRRTLALAMASAVSGAGLAAPAFAQTPTPGQVYPNRPVRLIVPFTTGGVLDTLARTIAQELSRETRQPVVVENRTGASGNIGTELIAKSPADGYVLGMGTIATHGINPGLYGARLPYDPIKDFEPIALVATQRNVVLVNASFPVRSIQELVAYAKSNPGKVSYGSAGNGSSQHMSGQMFMKQADVQFTHVPYRGSGPALVDLLGGNIQLMFVDMPAAMAHIKGGKLRPIGVTSLQRSPALPDVPTVAEQGLPGFEVIAWFGVFAPAGTPQPIVADLSRRVLAIMQMPEVRQKMEGLGADPTAMPPQAFREFIAAEISRWTALVRDLNVKLD
jgi:tripartite-type tricarboxylate transporter receptor subunit TctC